jgi:hypothetical protein
VAKPKSEPTISAAPAAPDDDFTPAGVDLGPFDIPADQLSPEGRARLVEQFKTAEREAAELAKARAVIDNYLNAPTRVIIVESKAKLLAKPDKSKPPRKARPLLLLSLRWRH